VSSRGPLATARAAATAATAAVTAGLVLLPATAAVASRPPDDGAEPGSGFSVIETLLWFVVLPGALFVLIALLVAAPSMARGPRYRPGLGWWAAPIWFNGPDDADNAVRKATATAGGGGASARW
jgi:hypothetical protein